MVKKVNMKLLIAFIVVLFLGAFGIGKLIAESTRQTVTSIVIHKERIVERRGDSTNSYYLIFTEDETFKNTDTLKFWKFNSSDIYGRIKVNSECEFDVYGFRVNFLSMYRNIISVNCN
jgi:hypothetical protein